MLQLSNLFEKPILGLVPLLASAGEAQVPIWYDLPFWSLVIFLVLVFVLWKFAGEAIANGLDNREKSIAESIAAAERSQQGAKRMLTEYEAKLAGAAAQVQALLDEARRDAEHTRQEILAEAKLSAEAERNRALREIATATDGALKQLAEASADMAVAIAGRVVRSQLSPADHTRLVQEAMTRFPQNGLNN